MHRPLLCALMISAAACSATNEKSEPQPVEKIAFETIGSITVSLYDTVWRGPAFARIYIEPGRKWSDHVG